ncbi:MAG TPA: bifunctional DNA-formamidopyrimidine glycosylase/DNA-(apurinic or apyrimidinic site) lyase [Thermoanaerobaculia bacterium]|nr:bifunctional DNA-formamidopyrimidine glycosylase/DNA-(apurinic or apyrimidinic site) lyase [Thermoanaerobaculia bacterium]
MPELPEVEVLRRTLAAHLVGDTVETVEVRERRLRERVVPATLRRRLAGRRLLGVDRRAKYLLLHFDGGSTLAVHLGMSGRLTIGPGDAPREPHEHAVFRLGSGRKLRFRDPRRFGALFALDTAAIASDRHFAGLGLEPLEPGFDAAALAAAGARRSCAVKAMLMDAKVVVGVGNIYASEALFRAGIHPSRSVARVSRQRWGRLAVAVVEVLRDAMAQGGTTLNDFADALGESGYFQVSLAVYDREGEPCPRCGAAIRRLRQLGRSTYYCPSCQR